jgi:peptidoglycan biosynthesis protein MviN/MurJ (putative lipid II flippase)
VFDVFWRVFRPDFDRVILILIALIEGVVVALLVFVWRQKKRVANEVESAGVGAVLALVGTGCAGCGTSLLAPIMGVVFSSGGYVMASLLGWVVTIAAFMIGGLTARRLGIESYVMIKSDRRKKRVGTNY